MLETVYINSPNRKTVNNNMLCISLPVLYHRLEKEHIHIVILLLLDRRELLLDTHTITHACPNAVK